MSTTPANPPLQNVPEASSPAGRTLLPSWKSETGSRVARRTRAPRVPENQPALPGMETAVSPKSIAARVAERYANIPSYRDMMAAQAAEAAEAAAAARQTPSEPAGAESAVVESAALPHQPEIALPLHEELHEPVQQELLRYSVSIDSLPAAPVTPSQARVSRTAHAFVEDEFGDPLEAAIVEPAHPLPARLIENPRELIAPRKARPRLAEGPLREEGYIADEDGAPEPAPKGEKSMASAPPPEGLRTRETDPRTASSRNSASPRSQWLSIQLDTESTVREQAPSAQPAKDLPLHVASFEDRTIAALIDCGLVASAFLLFTVVFALSTTHFPSGRIAVAGAAAILLAMGLLYQYLFFTLTDATPGMRYARIALCTFEDENPTRTAMRARIAALLLSALPLGLGFLWAVFDEDSLGWHDRITRTYQRSYRNL